MRLMRPFQICSTCRLNWILLGIQYIFKMTCMLEQSHENEILVHIITLPCFQLVVFIQCISPSFVSANVNNSSRKAI
jgi:hypothetical protein